MSSRPQTLRQRNAQPLTDESTPELERALRRAAQRDRRSRPLGATRRAQLARRRRALAAQRAQLEANSRERGA